MSGIINRLLVGLGMVGSLVMIVALAVHLQQPAYEVSEIFSYWLTFGAAVVSLLANGFAIANLDETGVTQEGRVTSIIPTGLAVCGLALTVRWAPDRIPVALGWFMLQLPGLLVGFRTTTSTLQQSLRRAQSIDDRKIAIQWELKQLTNRIAILEQLVRPGGPDPVAQKKLASTGNSIEKYYGDTKIQLERFLEQVEDEAQRTAASSMLATLQQMQVDTKQ